MAKSPKSGNANAARSKAQKLVEAATPVTQSPAGSTLQTIEREQAFIQKYTTNGFNGARAILDCGAYNASDMASASVTAAVLLRRPRVQMAIREITGRRYKRWEVTAENVIRELAALSFSNMGDFMKITDEGQAYVDLTYIRQVQKEDPEKAAMMLAAVQELSSEVQEDGVRIDPESGETFPINIRKTKLRLYDKRTALELLGKHLGIFREAPPPPANLNVQINLLRERLIGDLNKLPPKSEPKTVDAEVKPE